MRKLSQKRLLKKIVKHLSAIKDLRAIILYGSFAREDYGPKSDIDLLILTTNPDTNLEIQDKIINLELKKSIQPTIRTLKELKQTDTGLLQNIFLEGKIIYLKEPLDINTRLLLQQRPYVIYTFNLSELDQKTKAKLNRELYQRKSKDYTYKGALQKIGGKKLSSGSIMVAYENKKVIDKIFQKYRVNFETIKVWK